MCLFPKEEFSSTYDVPFDRYYSYGVRGVIFDIDNTLVLHDEPADQRSIELFTRLRNLGFSTCIVSNNGYERVSVFANATGSDYVENAGKPGPAGYIKALESMKLPKDKVIAIGDQILTDIWGANNAGIYSVLVRPLGPEKYFHIVLKRIIEIPILALYHLFGKKGK